MRKNILGVRGVLIVFFLAIYGSAAVQAMAEPQGSESTQEKKSIFKLFRSGSKKELTSNEKLAREYRQQGIELQKAGDLSNLQSAKSFFQKAVITDPNYAVAYNDLGVVYEAMGMPGKAEEYYKKAVEKDPNYLSAYSNLAALFETKRDFENAYYYWNIRAEYGNPNDAWTQTARRRVGELIQTIPVLRDRFVAQESQKLSEQIAEQKRIKRLAELKEAENYFNSARQLFKQKEYLQVIEEIEKALELNPDYAEATNLLNMAREKQEEEILKQKEQLKQINIEKMQQIYASAIGFYQQDDPQAAKNEFDKLAELAASLQEENLADSKIP